MLIIGGGVVGCMTAMELVNRGFKVTIVERNQIAALTSGESSWAGAGIVFPLLPWMYRDEVNQLAQSGMLIKPPFNFAKAKAWCEKSQFEFAKVGDDLLLPKVAQVRNPRLLQALKQWLIMHGVTLIERTQLAPIQETAALNVWHTTTGEALQADIYVVTSGAWSFELLKETAANIHIKLMRGQILLYQLPKQTLQHIVYQDGFYLVPRRDGFLLAGSTLEDVGFDANVTEIAKQEMQTKAEALMPELKNVEIHKHWSGLRPGAPDNIPTIGQHPTIKNLYLNTGHFRYGVTMAPASAKILADLL